MAEAPTTRMVPHAGPALAPDWQRADSTHQSITKLPPDLSDEAHLAHPQSTVCIQSTYVPPSSIPHGVGTATTMPFTPEDLQNLFGDVADDARKIDEDRLAFLKQTETFNPEDHSGDLQDLFGDVADDARKIDEDRRGSA